MVERTQPGEELPHVCFGAQIDGVPFRAGQLRQRFGHPRLAARHDDDTRTLRCGSLRHGQTDPGRATENDDSFSLQPHVRLRAAAWCE